MQDDQVPPHRYYTIAFNDSSYVEVLKQMISWNGDVIEETVVTAFDKSNCGGKTPYFAAVQEAERLNKEFEESLR